MVTVYFRYKTGDGNWHDGKQQFNNVKKAERFIRAMNRKPTTYVDSWACDDPHDNEILVRKNLLMNPFRKVI